MTASRHDLLIIIADSTYLAFSTVATLSQNAPSQSQLRALIDFGLVCLQKLVQTFGRNSVSLTAASYGELAIPFCFCTSSIARQKNKFYATTHAKG